MQGRNKVYIARNLEQQIKKLIKNQQSALIFGARQTGKTTLVKQCLLQQPNTVN